MSEPTQPAVNNSYVIWFKHGMYTLAWGPTPEAALDSYMANWRKSVREVVPTSNYRNQLPPHLYLTCPIVAVAAEPTIHQPLGQVAVTAPAPPAITLESLAAQVAALTNALAEKPTKKAAKKS